MSAGLNQTTAAAKVFAMRWFLKLQQDLPDSSVLALHEELQGLAAQERDGTDLCMNPQAQAMRRLSPGTRLQSVAEMADGVDELAEAFDAAIAKGFPHP